MLPPPEPPQGPSIKDSTNPATVYNISAQGNAARLEQVMPVIYGRHLVYPDFASRPYTEFINNEQYLFELFVIGLGEYDVEQVRIEDSDIRAFKEVEYRVHKAYEGILPYIDHDDNNLRRLLVNPHVVTAAEVTNIELQNEGEWFGPFAVVGPIFKIDRFSVDIILPSGLTRIGDHGEHRDQNISFQVEYRVINERGQPHGNYVNAGNIQIMDSTIDPIRKTYSFDVPFNRYEVRVKRSSAKHDNVRIRDQIYWSALKGYVAGHIRTDIPYLNYTVSPNNNVIDLTKDATLLSVRIRATRNISGLSARKVNCIVTRKLRVLEDDDTGNKVWSSPQPTTNIAWALADVCTADYGGKLSYDRLDQQKLIELAQRWQERGDSFNAVFDRKLALWEALNLISRAGRSVPVMMGGIVSFVRDEERAMPSGLFSSQNIIKDSLSFDYIAPSVNIADRVSIKYFDQRTWTPTITEIGHVDGVDSISVLSPEIDMFGVTGEAQARREGVYIVRTNKLRRKMISFETELEGSLVTYGDDILLSHDSPELGGISGTLTGLDSLGRFKTSTSLFSVIRDDTEVYTVVFSNQDGSLVAHPDNETTTYFDINKEHGDNWFTLSGDFYKGNQGRTIPGFEPIFDSAGGEGTFFSLGRKHIAARVISVVPSSNKTVTIDAVEQEEGSTLHASENVIDREFLNTEGLVDEANLDVERISIVVSSNQYNYDLFQEASRPSAGVIVTCTINSGVVIGSINAQRASMYIGGFNSASIIKLINNGKIYGAGGVPGVGATTFYYPNDRGGDGGVGGDAIEINNVTLIDNSNGFIYAGGGGGGGHCNRYTP